MEVIDSVQNLSETESSHPLIQWSILRDQVEQVSVFGQLEGYVLDLTHLKLLRSFGAVVENESLTVSYHFDDILVFEVAQNIGFLFEVSLDLCRC